MKNFALGYGLHLTLDGYECSQEQLANLDVICEFLDKCPNVIQMTKIMPPYVFKYHAPAPEDWGVSGFVLIAESHISIHTYPEKRYLSLDIFSCKHFDYQKALAYIDLKKTLRMLRDAHKFVRDTVADGGKILFVGTKKQAKSTIEEEA